MARIEGYRFGHVVVDGEEHTRDVIVLPNRVVANWWRKDGHSLVLEDLDEVLEELPDRLVVGTGHDQRMRPDPAALEELRRHGIEVEAISRRGIVLRDSESGLLDFPGLVEGEEVFLCWRLGEDRVAWWHGPETGFAGRKPL